MPQIFQKDFTISVGAAVSDSYEMGYFQRATFFMPSVTGNTWTAASLTLEISQVAAPSVDADWRQVYTRIGGLELIMPAALGRALTLEGDMLPVGFRHIRLISGVAGTRVNQVTGSARVITGVFYRN